jgi:hypothetical protein
MAGVSSQGTLFTFSGSPYTVTRVTVSSGSSGGGGTNERNRVSAAHLGSDPDAVEPFFYLWQPDPAGKGALAGVSGTTATGTTATVVQSRVEIDFIGASRPVVGSVGPVTISGAVNLSFSGATCMASSVTASMGDIVRGSATFTVT